MSTRTLSPVLITLCLAVTMISAPACGDSGGSPSGDPDTGGDDVSVGGDSTTGSDGSIGGDDTGPDDDTAMDGDDASMGGDDASMGHDDTAMGGDDPAMGGDDTAMGGHDASMDHDETAMGGDDASMGGDDTAMGGDDTAMGGDDTAMGGNDASMGGDAVDAGPTVDEFFASFCADSCAEHATECDDLTPVGGTEEGCITLCEERLAESTEWIANYSCLEDNCNMGACFPDDQPLPAFDGCGPACAVLDACDLAWVLELPEDEPELCVLACSGAFANQPFIGDGLECLVDSLEDTCDPAAFEGCFGEGGQGQLGCEAMCDSFLNPESGSDFVCADDDPIHEVWPTMGDCVAACEEVPEEAKGTMYGCWIAQACANPAACEDVPAESFPACDIACEGVHAVCGPDVDMPPEEFCGSLCTGILSGFGLEGGNPDAATCIEQLDSCPEDDAFGAVFECAMAPIEVSENCAALCSTIETCTGDGDGDCPAGCSQLELQQPEAFAAIEGCVEAAGEDCAAILACLPSDGGDGGDAPPMCMETCTNIETCGGTEGAPTEGCIGQCGQALSMDIGNVAVAVCQANASCEDLSVCAPLANEVPLTECAAACESASACEEWPEGTCELACSGAVIGLGLGGMGAADCIVGKIGAGCQADASGCEL